MRQVQDEIRILNAKDSTGIGLWVDVTDYKTISFTIDTASSANMTIKLVGSNSEDSPTPTSAQSKTNRYEYIQMIDLNTNIPLDGDTGLVLAGTDDNRLFQANVNGLKWVTLYVTARSAGNVTAYIKAFGT